MWSKHILGTFVVALVIQAVLMFVSGEAAHLLQYRLGASYIIGGVLGGAIGLWLPGWIFGGITLWLRRRDADKWKKATIVVCIAMPIWLAVDIILAVLRQSN